jgi:hypothetical protein
MNAQSPDANIVMGMNNARDMGNALKLYPHVCKWTRMISGSVVMRFNPAMIRESFVFIIFFPLDLEKIDLLENFLAFGHGF